MYYFGYCALILTFLASAAAAACCIKNIFANQIEDNWLIKNAHLASTLGLLLASAALMHGLFWQDYSLQYAANYTDKYLSLFYRLTAFWAGQPGSMLFWALIVGLIATIFALTKSYQELRVKTKLWFWTFYYIILVFFALILTCYSNPFIMQTPVPADGNGLNPLLQNPGMIIHPPLLFIGYAGFILPSCLALAQLLSQDKNEPRWHVLTRPFLIWAWMFLTAGILLGAWWAYMELGWGGYWAWDPVENSSLVPWLLATATLHTIIIERKTQKLVRYNTTLIAITTISTFFATFLVRSGVIDSVHAFGKGAVGTPLLIMIVASLILTFTIVFSAKKEDTPLAPITTKEGLLAFMSWFLIALSLIILLATVWPILSKFVSQAPKGLDANFYNKVCLPLAAILMLILAICPLRNAKNCFTSNIAIITTIIFFIASAIALYVFGYQVPIAIVATAAAVATIISQIAHLLNHKKTWSKHLGSAITHIGLALCTIGVAFSGCYDLEKDIFISQGQSVKISQYTLTLEYLGQENGPGYSALVAQIQVQEGEKDLGLICPERRIYEKFGDMQFSEVDTIPSLGNELYASLLGLNQQRQALVRFSIKPLVNWLWIGGFILSLAPFLALYLPRRKES